MYRVNGTLTGEYKINGGVVKFYDLKRRKIIILSTPIEIEKVSPEIYINGKLFEDGDIDEFIKKNSEYVDCKIPFERIEYYGNGVTVWY